MVGFHHPALRHIDDQHRVCDRLEQQAVTRFHVTQTKVIPLHRLVRLNQPPLHLRHAAQIAAEYPKLIRADLWNSQQLQGHIYFPDSQIHVPPGTDRIFFRLDQQIPQFVLAVEGGLRKQGFALPILEVQALQFFAGGRDLQHHSLSTQDDDDIRQSQQQTFNLV